MSNKLCYFVGDDGYDSLDDAVEHILGWCEFNNDEVREIQVYKMLQNRHSHYVSGSSVLENFAEIAYNNNEYAEDYLSDVIFNKEKCKELENIIVEWLGKNAESPRFWEATGDVVEEIVVNKEWLILKGYLEK